MRHVGAFEAKNKLSELLDLAEGGEEIIILRHGKEVARLLPVRKGFDRAVAKAAVAGIREMSKNATLGKLKIKDLIGEGRQ